MPAVAIVADAVISDIVGTGIVDAVASVTGSMLLGEVASGAVIGAVGGGLSAAVQGGDIWKGVEMGALSGGVSAGITGALEGTQYAYDAQGNPVLDSSGNQVVKMGGGVLGGSDLSKAVASGLGSAGGSLATGQSLGTALESGALSGLIGYAIPGSNLTSTIERGLTSSGLRTALGIGAPETIKKTGGPTITGTASQRAGSTPGSAALGQALNIGDAGSPIFGSKGDEKGKKKVWNVESLRYMGQPEESSSG
jgi:hypothetical protein